VLVKRCFSLVVWDLETSLPKFSFSQPNTPQPLVPRSAANPDRTLPRMVYQAAPAEIVTAISFVSSSPSLLLAGIAGRFLRLHDLRTPSTPSPTIPAKAASLASDPYDSHRIACVGDGVISIWDMRKLASPILLFSSADARGDGAHVTHGRTTHNTSHPAVSIEWARSRRGLLASLEREDNHVRFWDVQQVPPERTHSEQGTPRSLSREHSQGRSPRLSWTNASSIMSSWSAATSSQPTTTNRDGPAQSLVLGNTWKSGSILI
jgi:WD repeat-containing protein mio